MYYFLGVFLILLGHVLAQNKQINRVNVTVYYESLCPYARNFTINQLYPILQGNLSHYVNLELIPYGKANRTSDINSDVSFNCQHGPIECYGNLIQGCSRDLIDYGSNTDDLGFNKNHLDFVECFMKNVTSHSTRTQAEEAVVRCSKPKVISASRLKTCANNTFGIQHLIHYGKITDSFQKPLEHVPTIVFNGVYNEEESDGAQEDFLAELCSKIIEPKPKECDSAKILQRKSSKSSVNSFHTISQFLIWYTLVLMFYLST
ncbi:unnamed protein product [Psylliodes chrysocephalus]|uniref:Gamma-interferon-inducible lysosomal thiol reductase n=1 Tax=Psylliodes chrysocephalus TaxID=3402493 RepID=A0A9P0CWK9_9CUCU|nr:unnamed protein product [Psylliodes chrysocephala]